MGTGECQFKALQMALLFFLLFPLLAVGDPQPAKPINQTDLQVAMADMRTWSYHGFVILLKILNGTGDALRDREITFFMPSDDELSKVALALDSLQYFILSHSIPTALLITHLVHFPNGTLVPSGVPNQMLRITNNGRSGLFVNNARLATPNVCLNSQIRCHGISAALKLDNVVPSVSTLNPVHLHPKPMDSSDAHRKGKSLSSDVKWIPGPY
ncbi:hypothetical protein K2173_007619 [Erythroxylum novogranatense]|uniref:FAS1 domain-containing protein n=1 Tax=Erythroxylum novogranatense TaxID=1862640 RepID=A0AAV8S908_9ROSI|nr:hypothetical protein K2173_007619 [Erythroxylum novogranatense]